MTTTLTITSGQTSFTAQGYTILPSPGTAVPDNLAQAILSAATTAGVVLSSSAGTGVITVPSRRFNRSGVGPPVAGEGSWLLGDEIVDSANTEYECSAPGNPGTWTTAQSGSFASLTARVGSVATRSAAYIRGQSSQPNLGGTSRVYHLAVANASKVRLVYGNTSGNSVPQADGPNAITVGGSVEDNAGRLWRVSFNGKRQVTIDPGQVVVSDPCPAVLVAGQSFHTRTFVSVTGTQTYPLGQTTGTGPDDGGHNYASGGGADLTVSGTVPGAFAFVYSPLAILGNSNDVIVPTVGGIGDSIDDGQGDTPSDTGWLPRVLGSSRGYVRASQPGEQAANFLASLTTGGDARLKVLAHCQHIIEGYGRNDLANGYTLAQIQANRIKVWTLAAGLGAKVYARTLVPETTSTDSWATTTNQTGKSYESIRVGLNQWLRAGAPMSAGVAVAVGTGGALLAGQAGHPLTAAFDLGGACESAQDSGKWKASYTSDGVHPLPAGHAAMAAALPLSTFS